MKKILKDRYLYAIVILFLALSVYCYFANNGNNSFMPSYTAMPITDMTIDMILFLSIVALGAYRFHIIGDHYWPNITSNSNLAPQKPTLRK